MSKSYKKDSLMVQAGTGEPVRKLFIPDELSESIADTAREGYQSEGRGLVIAAVEVEKSEDPPGIPRMNVNEFYIPVDKLRHVRTAIPHLSDDAYDQVVQLVKTYNPIIDFVVLLSVGDSIFWYKGDHPVSFVPTA
ncbi:MAG: hypothetical protein HC884_02710 [Chloroflexaceae bacterium]|nr:hypothetical protein [Chloroflexaceae bacterium]